MSHDEDIDARLARLMAGTEGVGPRPGFSNRVMTRIAEEPPGMLAACLAMVWAVSVTSQVDEALAAGDDTELSW
jgi:hypothetical protein